MLSRQSWDATYNDASSFLNTLKSDSEENVGHWKNAQYDALLNQATQITDATKRNALYQQAEVIINQQAPLIPHLLSAVNQTASNPTLAVSAA